MKFASGLLWVLMALGLSVIWWKRPDIPLGGNRKPLSYAASPWRWRLVMLVVSTLVTALLALEVLRAGA
ncbi:hypothetical protein EIP75_20935 [Aquabacterium soli]|jgi:hypothetical protein|uniref:Uncharacterized protein n=1 Tax=Aquabacterium soli TaxID=2493092 RepID=A0A3R8S0A9_9BURK|nr:hypothetical protein [Aquabacterium soli]RRS02415.1 hypothetical protein EIP75_20935 [Aquabacterium soli]